MIVNGQEVEPVYKEDDLDSVLEASPGLHFCHERRRYCAIAGRFIKDDRWLYENVTGPCTKNS